MSDHFYIQFSDTEQTAQTLLQDGQALYDTLHRVQNVANRLYASGLQGSFLDDVQAHIVRMQDNLRYLASEGEEAGRDLHTVVEQARQLDADCARLFESIDGAIAQKNFPALSPTQARTSLNAWRKMRKDELEFIDELHRQTTGWQGELNKIAGTHDDYRRLLLDAQRRLKEYDEHIALLEADVPDYQDDLTLYEVKHPGFNRDELLDQGDNPSCVIYAAMNMLVQQGVDISQSESEEIFREFENLRGSNGYFPLEDAVTIFNRYGYNVTLEQYRYSESTQPVKHLIAEIQAGRPVYVGVRNDFAGNADAAHAMVVNGVNLDANGNLESVRVSTNYTSTPAPEIVIPADLFLSGWAAKGYTTISINQGQN
jgi:hypothetical protein